MVDQGARVARRSEPLTFGAPRALTHVRGNVLARCTRLGLAENDFQSSCASLEPVLGPREARTRGPVKTKLGGARPPSSLPDFSRTALQTAGEGGPVLTRAGWVRAHEGIICLVTNR